MAVRFASGERVLHHESKILRQPLTDRLVHWGVALSILVLFLSGFGQMPIFKRYGMADLPGMAWMANYAVTLALHYVAAIVLVFAGIFHAAYHSSCGRFGLMPRRGDVSASLQIIKAMLTRGKEPPSDKYLAEQRLAYAFIAGNALVLILTGLFKMADNLPAFSFPWGFTFVMTQLHNLSTVLLLLGIVGHLVAFIFPANRKLLTAMFHGKVDLTYVEHRHCLWYDRLAAVHKHGLPDHAQDAEHQHAIEAEAGASAPDAKAERAAQADASAEASTMEAASTTEAMMS